VLGAEDAGKSSLLAHKFAFPLQSLNSADQESLIYYNEKKLIFNIPGAYLQENFQPLWPALARQLKQTCKATAPAGIFMLVNIRQWLNQTAEEQQHFVETLNRCLNKLVGKPKHRIPITLLLTHADQLTGFVESFHTLNGSARQQPLGLYLDLPVQQAELKPRFQRAYQQLLQRLQRFALLRIQQERTQAKQIRIKNFPLQIDALQNSLFTLLHQFDQTLPSHYHWHWVALISNEQTPASLDLLAPALQQIFPAAPAHTTTQTHTQDDYFSADILGSYFKPAATMPKSAGKIHHTLRYLAYGSAAALTMVGTFSLANYFSQHMQALNQADVALQQFRFRAPELNARVKLTTLIQALQNLQQAVQHLTGIQPRSQLTRDAQRLLTLNLQNQFLPRIARILEVALTQKKQQPSNELYNVLKAYLMLGEPQYLQVDFLTQTVNRYLPHETAKISLTTLSQLLQSALQHAHPEIRQRDSGYD